MGETQYLWDVESDNVLQELDEFGDTQVTYTNEPAVFGNLVSQRRGTETSTYHFDGLGSTRELTNSSEVVTDTNMYDAWGANVLSSESTENSFRWIGMVGYFSGAAFVFVRRRIYNSVVARWASPDPIRSQDGRSEFLYAMNMPLRYVDPSGLSIRPGPMNVDPHGHNKKDFYDDNDCCTLSDMKLICRTMPTMKHFWGTTHCYLAFADKHGDWAEVISGGRGNEDKTGLEPTIFTKTFWDRNWATGNKDWIEEFGAARQFSHAFLLPKGMNLCEAYDCLYDAADKAHGTFYYKSSTTNSNYFLTKVMKSCGLWANFPATAVGSDDLGPMTYTGCLKECMGIPTLAREVERERLCNTRCKRFNRDPVRFRT